MEPSCPKVWCFWKTYVFFLVGFIIFMQVHVSCFLRLNERWSHLWFLSRIRLKRLIKLIRKWIWSVAKLTRFDFFSRYSFVIRNWVSREVAKCKCIGSYCFFCIFGCLSAMDKLTILFLESEPWIVKGYRTFKNYAQRFVRVIQIFYKSYLTT